MMVVLSRVCVFISIIVIAYSLQTIFLSMNIVYVIAKGVDPDEMPHNASFIWVLTACHKTHLGVTSIERVKSFAC